MYLNCHSSYSQEICQDGDFPWGALRLQDPLITWSFEITWDNKINISLSPQCIWLWNLAGCWLALRGSLRAPIKSHGSLSTCSREITRQTLHETCLNTEFFLVRIFPHSDWIRTDTPYLSVFSPNAGKYRPGKTPYLDTFHAVNLKPVYLHYHNVYSHQHWHVGDLP